MGESGPGPGEWALIGHGVGLGGWATLLNKRVREDLLERVPP